MKCPNCGEENDGLYCIKCGTPLQQNPTENGEKQYGQDQYSQNNYSQNQYSQNQYNQNQYSQNQYDQNNNYGGNSFIQPGIPEEYRPIGMWGYFGYQILFAIPCIGLICLIIFSFGGAKNKNLKNFARSYFCVLIIFAVLAMILAATGALGAIFAGARYY